MLESDIVAQILLECSRGQSRAFRANAGIAWQGKVLRRDERILVLEYPRPVHLMPEGCSDLIGIVGPAGRFAAIEVKRPKERPTEAQARFLALVASLGGLSGVAHSAAEARAILDGA